MPEYQAQEAFRAGPKGLARLHSKRKGRPLGALSESQVGAG
jgi:hypothetical protein